MLDGACGVFFSGGSRGYKGRGGDRKWGWLSRQREHLLHWLLDTNTGRLSTRGPANQKHCFPSLKIKLMSILSALLSFAF